MPGGFHLQLFSEKPENRTYELQALTAAITRDARLLSLNIDAPNASDTRRSAYPPLDHVIEAAIDASSLGILDARTACCVLTDRSTLLETDSIHHQRMMRSLVARDRLATFDQEVWGRLRIEIGAAPQLLIAPALQTEPRAQDVKTIAVFVNDQTLASSALAEITARVESIMDGVNVIVKDNRWHNRLSASEWLEPQIRNAVCHVHLGAPFAGQAYGRLIDSVACLLPVILVADDVAPDDFCLRDAPPSPVLLHEIHFFNVTSTSDFGAAFAELFYDVALRGQLAANSAILCREHNRQAALQILSFILGERVGVSQ